MKKLTHEQFVEKLSELNPNLVVVSQYTASKEPIIIKCSICDNEFQTTPNSLMCGSSCPVCSNIARYEKTRKEHDTFIEELHGKNPSIEVIGEYKTNKTHILVKCKKCATVWNGLPCHLLRGHGCPVCANEKRREAAKRNRIKRK